MLDNRNEHTHKHTHISTRTHTPSFLSQANHGKQLLLYFISTVWLEAIGWILERPLREEKSIFFSFSFNALSVTLSERKVNQSAHWVLCDWNVVQPSQQGGTSSFL